MIVVVADTSGLVAALDETHPDRVGAVAAIQQAGLLVVSSLLLAEFDHVATRELGRDAAVSGVDELVGWARRGRVVFPEVTTGHLAKAQSVRAGYASLDLDLTDAVHVALAAEYQTNEILTLDRRDFRTIVPLTRHGHFRVLPDDL